MEVLASEIQGHSLLHSKFENDPGELDTLWLSVLKLQRWPAVVTQEIA